MAKKQEPGFQIKWSPPGHVDHQIELEGLESSQFLGCSAGGFQGLVHRTVPMRTAHAHHWKAPLPPHSFHCPGSWAPFLSDGLPKVQTMLDDLTS